jgi:hypothetical protein
MKYYQLFLPLVSLILLGCGAKVAPPVSDISNAKIALMKAKDMNASDLATTTYDSAQNYFKQTKSFMDKKEYAKAKMAAQKAHIEARLSAAEANNKKLEKKVNKLSGEINIIKKEFTTITE